MKFYICANDAEASRNRTHLLLENKKQNTFASENNLEFTRVLESTRKKGLESTRKQRDKKYEFY